MSLRPPTHKADRNGKTAGERQGWYATFSLLDARGAISSSELQALFAAIARLWRSTIGRLADRLRPRVVA